MTVTILMRIMYYIIYVPKYIGYHVCICMYIIYIHMYMQYIYTVVLKTKRVFYASTSAYWAWGYYLLYIPPWIYI